ncbi:aminotransferase class V-fold PLP-dependent enzyme [Gorillibacterium massiliense]|uniref:aminotransferase class V-fold PLP-dependent enzyme n=1 Tax=Gorillibacterium massiliense TaxID=1280390 RepID=UPI00069403E2|nr:aminotransferase class V-fold PLP-dependent enzyme [Gorillibacterium massiliense]
MEEESHKDLNENFRPAGELEAYFAPFRQMIAGAGARFRSPCGIQPILYADWAASGRMYRPIEEKLLREFGPYAANVHSEATATGAAITLSYREAKDIIKKHVHAGPDDILLFCGNGMTTAVNKLQRMMGLRLPEKWRERLSLQQQERPVVFVTHMEHHSNHTSWLETIADVHIVEPGKDGQVDPRKLAEALELYRERPMKIGAFTAASNVTGILPPLRELAEVMHRAGGLAFADWTAAAPVNGLDMHPASPWEKLDAVYFSPHKFLGGPGSSGVLLLDSRLSASAVPDHPGGGTVLWTDRWGGRTYVEDMEEREDGGTPGWVQAVKAALCIRLKERMGIAALGDRERELTELLLSGLGDIPGIRILDGHRKDRLGIVSFYAEHVHFPLFVRLLNDRFGIQSRGGCSCAGTYGHFLFGLSKEESDKIRKQVEGGILDRKPGWVRLSIHPVMTDAEIRRIIFAVQSIAKYANLWGRDYRYDSKNNDYVHNRANPKGVPMLTFDI